MKIQNAFKFLLAPILGLSFAASSVAQSFTINWSSFDGGAGSSSGAGTFGAFALVGTIGQADAGPTLASSGPGGNYKVTGGFWSFLGSGGFQVPSLRISLAGTNAVLSWPNPSTGFDLEETLALGGSMNSWGAVNQTPDVVGAEKQVTVPVTAGPRFYRLRKP